MKKTELNRMLEPEILRYIAKYSSLSRGAEFKMTIKSMNCYFKFSRYGEWFKIHLYKSGDIHLIFHEFCHYEDLDIHLYAYNENDNAKELLPIIRRFLQYFIKDWFSTGPHLYYHEFCSLKKDCFDYHTDINVLKKELKYYLVG